MATTKQVKPVDKVVVPRALNPIRLQFAAAAMGGLIAKGSTFDHETIVKLAFQYADVAMEALGE